MNNQLDFSFKGDPARFAGAVSHENVAKRFGEIMVQSRSVAFGHTFVSTGRCRWSTDA